MINNITFRSGTLNKGLKTWALKQCKNLSKLHCDITRINIIFSNISHQKQSADKVHCHISLKAASHQNIDIYAGKSSEGAAFDSAFDRLSQTLARRKSAAAHSNRSRLDALPFDGAETLHMSFDNFAISAGITMGHQL